MTPSLSSGLARVQFGGKIGKDDRSLSILPWAHVFGSTLELHHTISFGGSFGIAESPQVCRLPPACT